MKPETLTFTGALGDRLAARLERPAAAPWAGALFAHCFTCSKDLKAVRRISSALVNDGIAVLSFDFTGLGESEGDFAATNFSSNVDDLVAAAKAMERELEAPAVLLGHSLGGAAALAAASRIPGVRAVATIGAPSDLAHLTGLLQQAGADTGKQAETEIVLAGRRFQVRRQLLEDLRSQNLNAIVADLRLPLLIFHSPVDEVVGIDHARRLYEAARHPKSFVSLDGADHLLLRDPQDAPFVGRTVAAWLTRYVGARDAGSLAKVAPLEPGEVLAQGGPSGFATQIRVGRHRVVADEPLAVGGTDTGPGPYDYLLTSLGACTSMTLRMYADRKGWPLEGVRVHLHHTKIYARDCEECETQKGRVDEIDRALELLGPLDNDQRQRLLEIADHCPVHRTLQSEVRIRTRLAPEDPMP
jgi:putative redox protein